ncbi:MAG: TonB-dependent receptor [Caulobacter sp.]|nr:TonB-dependent receptor [Caulobacter sp.]
MTVARGGRRLSRGLALLFASSGMLLGVSQVHAAEADAKAAGDVDRLEEVTVFARKRAENVQDVPVPITVINALELQRENLVNFTDFQHKFPSFSVYLTNPKQLNLGVRGIGNNGFNTDGIDGSVGIFVDGVYSGRQGMVSSDFNDIADVELLRGPQGTLFGKNTTAGAVIINSKVPSFTPEFAIEGTVGDQNLKQVKVSASGPLIEGKLAGRVSAFYSDKDGNYPNVHGGPAANARQGEGVRLQLLANLTDDATFRLIASHSEQNFNSIGPVTLSVYNPAALQARMAAAGYALLVSDARKRQVNIDAPLTATTHGNLVSGQFDWDLGDKGALTSITAFQNWTCFTNNDNDYTQLNALPDYGSCNVERQYSEEARWASPKGGPIEAVAGVFLSRQYLGVNSRIRFGDQYYIWAANPSASAFPALGGKTWAQGAYASAVAGFGIRSYASFHTDTQALFGNVVWHPDADKKWSVNLGLRQTWEDRDYSYSGWVESNLGNLNQAQMNAMSAAGANAQLGRAVDSLKDKSLSGQIGVNYQVTPNFMAYLTAARGHKSAGFNLLPFDPATAVYGAGQDVKGETSDNIEAGFKSEWFDRRLLLNVTAFDTEVKNYQANQAIGVGNTAVKFLANVGSLRSKGVEVESEARLGELRLKGFVAYNEATYGSFHNSVCPAQSTALTCDLTGRQVAWAPKWTTNLTVEYSHSFAPGTSNYVILDGNWRSKQNTTITLDPSAEIKSYALANLRVGMLLRDETIDVQVWSENLFDKAYYINLLGLTKSTGLIQGYPGNPRTIGATVRYHF